jgi:hypothetical protein
MKTRYLLFVTAIMIASLTLNAPANQLLPCTSGKMVQTRQQRTPEEMAKRQTDNMKTELTLTSDQLPKVDSINLKYARKMSEIRQQYQGNRQEMMPKMMDLGKDKRAELEKILTADQLKKYDTMMEERMKRMQNRQGGN